MPFDGRVFVVDDDEAVRRFLRGLIGSIGLGVETYASAQEFLADDRVGPPGCVVLDVRMPGMSGLELQSKLSARAHELPVIFLSGHGSVPVAVHAMRGGAIDFIEKPFNNELLLKRIQEAVTDSARRAVLRTEREELRRRLELLTPREREVLELIVGGQTNKGAARHLGISDKTVEVHRARVMEKMQATSLAQLVKMVGAERAGSGNSPS